jgi:hypothetical protein
MAKKVEIEVETNIEPSLKALKELKKELRSTAAGSEDFKKISKQIKDVEDALEESKQGAKGFVDVLEEAPGPVGAIARGFRTLEINTKSFGTALKATGIGLLVAAIGGIAAAFSQVEGAGKKLEPLMIGLEKIFGGIVEVFTPLLDMFLEMALKALPYITKGIGIFYSSLVGLFTLIKEVGTGAGKILKGIFTLDFDSLKEGYDQLSGSWDKTVKSFTDSMGRYDAGTQKMTKTEKANLEDRTKARQDALDKQLKMMETQDKMDAAQLEKMKQNALAAAETEQEKFDIEKKFFDMSYKEQLKNIEDKQKLYKKDSDEWKNLQTEKITLEAGYIQKQSEFTAKQKELTEKKNKELLDNEIAALNLKKATGEIKEAEYTQSLYEINKKYLTEKKDIQANELAYQQFLTNERKKLAAEDRATINLNLQQQIESIDRLNEMLEFDFAQDLDRLKEKKRLLEEQEANELKNTELTEFQKNEIRKKYSDARTALIQKEVATERAAAEQKFQVQSAYAQALQGLGSLFQQIAGQNKQLAILGIVIEKAAGLASIAINAKKNFIKDGGIKSPLAWANLAVAGVQAAGVVVAAVKGIQAINSASQGGGGASDGGQESGGGNSASNLGRNYEKGGLLDGPRHAQGGMLIEAEGGEAIMTRGAVTMFEPMLSMMNQMGGGTSFGNQMFSRPDAAAVEKPQESQSPVIMKTYVVSNELTTESEKQARLKDLSTL